MTAHDEAVREAMRMAEARHWDSLNKGNALSREQSAEKFIADYLDAMLARGWKMVAKTETDEMVQRAWGKAERGPGWYPSPSDLELIWRAMWDAAPSPQGEKE